MIHSGHLTRAVPIRIKTTPIKTGDFSSVQFRSLVRTSTDRAFINGDSRTVHMLRCNEVSPPTVEMGHVWTGAPGDRQKADGGSPSR
jgi:hypothetical protein